jgi:SAM-dependent MidA family methyltransferase
MGAGSGTLSNELVEKASRLMNTNAKGELLENKQPQQQRQQSNVGVDANVIRDIVRETVQDVLRENGLLTESETKSNEVFKFRVGQHIFEGKLIRVKKIAK